MSFISRMQEAARQVAVQRDPWERRLRQALEGVEAMSSAALLDLVDADPTTGNARRLARIMRKLNFIPIKTRRFMPGGFRDTVTRGWARPVRPDGRNHRQCVAGVQRGEGDDTSGTK
jgi:hypothetical protein